MHVLPVVCISLITTLNVALFTGHEVSAFCDLDSPFSNTFPEVPQALMKKRKGLWSQMQEESPSCTFPAFYDHYHAVYFYGENYFVNNHLHNSYTANEASATVDAATTTNYNHYGLTVNDPRQVMFLPTRLLGHGVRQISFNFLLLEIFQTFDNRPLL